MVASRHAKGLASNGPIMMALEPRLMFDGAAATDLTFVNHDSNSGALDGALAIAGTSDNRTIYVGSFRGDSILVYSRNTSTGELALLQTITDSPVGDTGLQAVQDFAISRDNEHLPDNKHLYVVGRHDDAISIYNIDNTGGADHGKLSLNRVIHEPTHLNGVSGVVVSSDGKSVYTASRASESIRVYDRDEITGDLVFVEDVTETSISTETGISAADTLEHVFNMVVSPDGRFLYATSVNSDTLLVFARDADDRGKLSLVEYFRDNDSTGTGGTEISDFNQPREIAISPDGKFLYGVAAEDAAITIFKRNTEDGTLTVSGTIKNNGGTITELGGARGITVSADGNAVFVAAHDTDTVLTFTRNNETGELTYKSSYMNSQDDGKGNTIQGIDGARSIVSTADGGSIYVTGLVGNSWAAFNTANQAPVIASGQIFSVSENASAGTAVGTATGTDPQGNALQSWTITGGNGQSLFDIDPATGAITVKSGVTLDYETRTNYTLNLTVSDGTNTSSVQTATINLTDQNDVIPVVTASQSFSVVENASGGTVVGIVAATDGDVSSTTFQNWTITGGTGQSRFDINPGTGAITVKNGADLNREAATSYTLTVTVSDGTNTSATETVTINLTDQNDVVPMVTAGQSFNVVENASGGTAVGTVAATDGDVSSTTFQNWTIIGGSGQSLFDINPGTGAITVKSGVTLDREAAASYTLTVTVSDGTNTSATETVTINLTDQNDVVPVVTAGQSFNVVENASGGTAVGTVAATDGDVSSTTFQNWTITGGSGQSLFDINPGTGAITVKSGVTLDREAAASYTVTVTVSDGTNTSTAETVTISLTDQNDVVPVVTTGQSFNVVENASGGTAVGTVAATDGDVSSTTFQNWTITGGSGQSLFDINATTGAITVKSGAALDREAVPSYTLTVTVSDGTNTSATETVTINLTDQNDVVPVVTTGQSFNVVENASGGTAVGTVAATDGDVTTTTFQNWTVTGGSGQGYFDINPGTGAITVKNGADLNREAATSYTLTVTVSDGTNTSATETVTINLTDQNDVVPVVTAGQSFNVVENAASGPALGTVDATDGDVSSTTFQNWIITGGSGQSLFDINATTGVITVKSGAALDREAASSYTLTVTVSDGINTSTAETVTINLTDQNDVAPVVNASQSFNVAENASGGTVVGTVAATDGDVTATTYQNWTITGGSGQSLFDINATTGEITVKSGVILDREAAPSYALTVTVSDGINTSAAEAVIINLTDQNDVAPVVTAGQTFNVAENASGGTAVGTVAATDGDTTATTFQNWIITGGSGQSLFDINASTGVITVKSGAALDREASPSYTLTVTVSDGTNTSTAETVIINLIDQNDVAPVVTAGQSFNVVENASGGTVVGTLTATDGDVTTTTFQNWTVTGGSGQGYFDINPGTGAITVKNGADLNREAATSYTLTVTVSDGTNTSATETVTINLTDQNDVVPVVTAGQSFNVVENAASGPALGTVDATDGDVSSTTFQNWTITGGSGQSLFDINPGTGAITVKSGVTLDREAAASYTLTVTVSDGTNTSGTESVTINLTDQNDVAPVVNASQSFNVAENASGGTVVGTVAATDGDVTATTYQNWTITGGSGQSLFDINATTGVITVKSGVALDREAAPSYTLTVTVSDGTSTSTAETLTINLTDQNDVAPVVTASQSFNVAENASGGTVVGTVAATDGDVTATTYQNWTITGGSGQSVFDIDASTGAITVRNGATLDYETATNHTLTVTVSDGVNTSATETVTINLTDQNDVVPVITTGQSFNVVENASGGTVVGTADATDGDVSSTTLQNWIITGGSGQGLFDIDASTGAITVRNGATLDYETATNYTVTVTVTVSDGTNISAAETITIDIGDVPDTPSIPSSSDSNGNDGGDAASSDGGSNAGVGASTRPGGGASDNAGGAGDTGGSASNSNAALGSGSSDGFGGSGTSGFGQGGLSFGAGGTGNGSSAGASNGGGTDSGQSSGVTGATSGGTGPASSAGNASGIPGDGKSGDGNISGIDSALPQADPAVIQAELARVEANAYQGDRQISGQTSGAGYPAAVLGGNRDSGDSGPGQLLTLVPVSSFDAIGRLIEIALPDNTFAHTRADAVVVLSAELVTGDPLPPWMIFDALSGTFRGEPPADVLGEMVVKVIARDQAGQEAVALIRLDLVGGSIIENTGEQASDKSLQEGDGHDVQSTAGQEANAANQSENQNNMENEAGVIDLTDYQKDIERTGKPSLAEELRQAARHGNAQHIALMAAAQAMTV